MDIDKPPDSWDFRLAQEFLHSFQCESQSLTGNETAKSKSSSTFKPASSTPKSLGDFNRIYLQLGLPLDPSAIPTASSSSSARSDCSTAESTPAEDVSDEAVEFEDLVSKEVRWKDQVPGGLNLAESQRRSHKVSLANNDFDQGDIEGSVTRTLTGCHVPSRQNTSITPQNQDDGLPPPKFSPKPAAYFEKHSIQPKYTLTQVEQEVKLKQKVRNLQSSIDATHPIDAASKNLHIFVDCSNIIIGHFERLKLDREITRSVKSPPISYKSLAFILERGRNASRRILVGSHNSAYSGKSDQLPLYMREARKCNYEMNILEPVIKPKVTPSKKARRGTGNGYATTSGHSSGSETFSVGSMARAEQGVDELLQMKMLESLLDSEPGTMVLASGDAAEAEYSGGFLKTVERALKKGWNVEVVAWHNGLSTEYTSSSFQKRWKGRFTIIELDCFSEEILAMYAEVYPAEQA
ncbi:hypothetical protein LCER1_G001055 [Lachnellula cervina]|uniref:NYN domain-containing protein n=1 Tax=Lachnellula cervina TaxID=1316786 RepID=A0A7D8YUE4_9HELO|nr:hypothetical protein LCER1_G001055 [Lachnellula cervina]